MMDMLTVSGNSRQHMPVDAKRISHGVRKF